MLNFGGVHIGVRSANSCYILFVFNIPESLGGQPIFSIIYGGQPVSASCTNFGSDEVANPPNERTCLAGIAQGCQLLKTGVAVEKLILGKRS
jgi:hypothetical protein